MRQAVRHEQAEVPQSATVSQPAAPASPSTPAQGGANTAPKQEKENGYLDIPAFLRRQAD